MSKLEGLVAKRMTLEEGRKIHEDWLAYIENGASVDTESLGDANWHRSAIKDYDAWIADRKSLIEKVEELEAQLLDANGTVEVLNGLINLRNISANDIKYELTKLRELRKMVLQIPGPWQSEIEAKARECEKLEKK